MLLLAGIVVSLVIGFLAGNFRRETVEKIKELRMLLDLKKDIPVQEDKKSTFIDPLDPVYEAKRRYEEQMRDLNE